MVIITPLYKWRSIEAKTETIARPQHYAFVPNKQFIPELLYACRAFNGIRRCAITSTSYHIIAFLRQFRMPAKCGRVRNSAGADPSHTTRSPPRDLVNGA